MTRWLVLVAVVAAAWSCDDGDADEADAGVGAGSGGGATTGPGGDFDPRSEYLRKEEDLAERYCRAILSCCTGRQLRALQLDTLASASLLTDPDDFGVNDCLFALRGRVDGLTLRDWDLSIQAGQATFDEAAYEACSAKVDALERCDGTAGFNYWYACPVFATGTGEAGDPCGTSHAADITPDGACGPGLHCADNPGQESPAGTCAVIVPTGGACDNPLQQGCDEPRDYCHGQDQICTAEVGPGGSCGDGLCGPGGVCESNDCPVDDRDCPPRICAPVDLSCSGRMP